MRVLALLSLLIANSLYSSEVSQLVNANTGFVVVEFEDGIAHFHDPFLEAEMKEIGISIPFGRKGEFEGKEIVYLGDILFEKAFIDVYYPISIANPLYEWRN